MSLFFFRKKRDVAIAPQWTLEQLQDQNEATALALQYGIERKVTEILEDAYSHKQSGKSSMVVNAYGFWNANTPITPTQQKIVDRLNELGVKAEIQYSQNWHGNAKYRKLLVSW